MNDPAAALAGRRELHLLELPSVARMAATLAERCREPSWIRTRVAALDRFRSLGGHDDLEGLLAAARTDPPVADQAMGEFARRRSELLGQPAVVATEAPGTEQPAVDTGAAGTESR